MKEGFYIGDEISTDHPYFLQRKLNSGPNQWPQSVRDPEDFKNTAIAYYRAAFELAKDILRILALTLDQDESFFGGFADGAVATMRLLHYPPQPKDSDEKLSRGIGAHQDFGAVTLLLQGDVDGLQVLDVPSGEWFDVSRLYRLNFYHRVSAAGRMLIVSPGRTCQRCLRRQSGKSLHEMVQRQV